MTKVLRSDVLVAGGGPAGLACALAAARRGAKVILCQDRPMLGGNASSEIRMHMVGANGMEEGTPLEAEARDGGIVEEIRLRMCVENPQRSPSLLDVALYDLCRCEDNLTLMLNTFVVGAESSGNRVTKALAERPSTEERFEILAGTYVDCTGDGRLLTECGVAFRQGREAREEHDESFAQESADDLTLGSTLLYQAKKHPRPMPFKAPSWARTFTADQLKLRPIGQPDMDLNLEYGFWWVEWGGQLNTIHDNEQIRDELLAILLGVWDYIKNASSLDAECWALDWVGFVPGKRESRRFPGKWILTQNDILSSIQFPDAIATGGWPIDTHPPHGVDSPEEPPATQNPVPFLYDIPLRCCLTRNFENLLFAGRHISATHIAFASTRVMATCAAIGQGVGTAIAYALRNTISCADLVQSEEHCRNVQQWLLQDDAMLLRHGNKDPKDLARLASISASSHQPGGDPSNCIDGYTRSLHGKPARRIEGEGPICAPENGFPAGTHRWMSDPADGFPAWIELSWPEAVSVRRIELTFDTGLHRLLTLSQADGYTRKMHWGTPQPETVADYRIEVLHNEKWLSVVEIHDNYQRKVRHQLDRPAETNRLRLTALKAHGVDHARLFEFRIYGE